MRRTLVTVVSCLAIAGLAGVAGASTTTSRTTVKSHAAKTAVHKAKHERFWGKVTAVDAKAMTITVHNGKKGDRTFTLSSKTRLREGSTDIKLDKIEVGSHVAIFYEMSGKSMVAISVHLHIKKSKAPMTKGKAKSGK